MIDRRITQVVVEADLEAPRNLRVTQVLAEVDLLSQHNLRVTHVLLEVDFELELVVARPRSFVVVVG